LRRNKYIMSPTYFRNQTLQPLAPPQVMKLPLRLSLSLSLSLSDFSLPIAMGREESWRGGRHYMYPIRAILSLHSTAPLQGAGNPGNGHKLSWGSEN
jgi:hypothetical protein